MVVRWNKLTDDISTNACVLVELQHIVFLMFLAMLSCFRKAYVNMPGPYPATQSVQNRGHEYGWGDADLFQDKSAAGTHHFRFTDFLDETIDIDEFASLFGR